MDMVPGVWRVLLAMALGSAMSVLVVVCSGLLLRRQFGPNAMRCLLGTGPRQTALTPSMVAHVALSGLVAPVVG